MKELTKKALLKESIKFNGSITELKEKTRIANEPKFKLEWISENEFTILPKVSLGTFILISNPDRSDIHTNVSVDLYSVPTTRPDRADIHTNVSADIYLCPQRQATL